MANKAFEITPKPFGNEMSALKKAQNGDHQQIFQSLCRIRRTSNGSEKRNGQYSRRSGGVENVTAIDAKKKSALQAKIKNFPLKMIPPNCG
jgi:hypothetical protein